MPTRSSSRIDANMEALVDALNLLPGITTFSSCGGHAKQSNELQRPASEFCVCFVVDVLAGGWRSLELITWHVANSDDFDKLAIHAWLAGDDPETLAFELEGFDNADPVALAKLLRLPPAMKGKRKKRKPPLRSGDPTSGQM